MVPIQFLLHLFIADIKNPYWTFPSFQVISNFFFAVDGNHYQFMSLSFTTVLAPVLMLLHFRGIWVFGFLDNLPLQVQSSLTLESNSVADFGGIQMDHEHGEVIFYPVTSLGVFCFSSALSSQGLSELRENDYRSGFSSFHSNVSLPSKATWTLTRAVWE